RLSFHKFHNRLFPRSASTSPVPALYRKLENRAIPFASTKWCRRAWKYRRIALLPKPDVPRLPARFLLLPSGHRRRDRRFAREKESAFPPFCLGVREVRNRRENSCHDPAFLQKALSVHTR